MCGPEDLLFTALLQFARVPFQAKVSVHKAPFWENLEILASTASIFAQILALKPPNLEIFSSQALKLGNFQFTSPKFGNFQRTSPPFQRQVLVRKPLTSEIRAAHPYLKKFECPPPPGSDPDYGLRNIPFRYAVPILTKLFWILRYSRPTLLYPI